jgi:hypothetical protein
MMVTVADVVSTISVSLGLIRELNQIDAQFDKASFKLKIAELTSKLAEAQLGLTELTGEIAKRDGLISDLQSALKEQFELIEHTGAKYRAIDGRPVGNQLCRLCIPREGLLIETREDRKNNTDICPNCGAVYKHTTKFLYPEQRPK